MTRPDLAALRIDRDPPRRGGRAGWIAFGALALLLAGWAGLRAWRASSDPATAVRVGRVARAGGPAATAGVAANGYVVARRRAALSTDVQGRIVELRVQEGDRVAEGEVIARIDTTQLEASRAAARADLRAAEAAAELARLERERIDPLVRSGIAAAEQADAARESLRQAVARADALRARIREIEVLIGKSTVRAPFAGVITQKNAEVGEVVSAMTGAGPNARGAVATLVDFDTLEVQVELAQTSLDEVATGAPVAVHLDAYPERPYRGRVRQIWPQADRQKATVELRVELLERDDRVLPEMGVRAVFQPPGTESAAGEPPQVLAPPEAVAGGEAEPHVFVFRPGAAPGRGTIERRAVRLGGRSADGRQVVEAGLVGGEQVVLDPGPALVDGAAVRLEEGSS